MPGKVGRFYSGYILVQDPDNDQIYLSTNNLPLGLKLKRCFNLRQLSVCFLRGTPRKSGFYRLMVYARDSRGAKTKKLLYLNISQASRLKYRWW